MAVFDLSDDDEPSKPAPAKAQRKRKVEVVEIRAEQDSVDSGAMTRVPSIDANITEKGESQAKSDELEYLLDGLLSGGSSARRKSTLGLIDACATANARFLLRLSGGLPRLLDALSVSERVAVDDVVRLGLASVAFTFLQDRGNLEYVSPDAVRGLVALCKPLATPPLAPGDSSDPTLDGARPEGGSIGAGGGGGWRKRHALGAKKQNQMFRAASLTNRAEDEAHVRSHLRKSATGGGRLGLGPYSPASASAAEIALWTLHLVTGAAQAAEEQAALNNEAAAAAEGGGEEGDSSCDAQGSRRGRRAKVRQYGSRQRSLSPLSPGPSSPGWKRASSAEGSDRGGDNSGAATSASLSRGGGPRAHDPLEDDDAGGSSGQSEWRAHVSRTLGERVRACGGFDVLCRIVHTETQRCCKAASSSPSLLASSSSSSSSSASVSSSSSLAFSWPLVHALLLLEGAASQSAENQAALTPPLTHPSGAKQQQQQQQGWAVASSAGASLLLPALLDIVRLASAAWEVEQQQQQQQQGGGGGGGEQELKRAFPLSSSPSSPSSSGSVAAAAPPPTCDVLCAALRVLVNLTHHNPPAVAALVGGEQQASTPPPKERSPSTPTKVRPSPGGRRSPRRGSAAAAAAAAAAGGCGGASSPLTLSPSRKRGPGTPSKEDHSRRSVVGSRGLGVVLECFLVTSQPLSTNVACVLKPRDETATSSSKLARAQGVGGGGSGDEVEEEAGAWLLRDEADEALLNGKAASSSSSSSSSSSQSAVVDGGGSDSNSAKRGGEGDVKSTSSANDDDDGDGAGGAGSSSGNFDLTLLSLTVLTNCVEISIPAREILTRMQVAVPDVAVTAGAGRARARLGTCSLGSSGSGEGGGEVEDEEEEEEEEEGVDLARQGVQGGRQAKARRKVHRDSDGLTSCGGDSTACFDTARASSGGGLVPCVEYLVTHFLQPQMASFAGELALQVQPPPPSLSSLLKERDSARESKQQQEEEKEEEERDVLSLEEPETTPARPEKEERVGGGQSEEDEWRVEDLVLSGYAALLLGCLMREHPENIRAVARALDQVFPPRPSTTSSTAATNAATAAASGALPGLSSSAATTDSVGDGATRRHVEAEAEAEARPSSPLSRSSSTTSLAFNDLPASLSPRQPSTPPPSSSSSSSPAASALFSSGALFESEPVPRQLSAYHAQPPPPLPTTTPPSSLSSLRFLVRILMAFVNLQYSAGILTDQGAAPVLVLIQEITAAAGTDDDAKGRASAGSSSGPPPMIKAIDAPPVASEDPHSVNALALSTPAVTAPDPTARSDAAQPLLSSSSSIAGTRSYQASAPKTASHEKDDEDDDILFGNLGSASSLTSSFKKKTTVAAERRVDARGEEDAVGSKLASQPTVAAPPPRVKRRYGKAPAAGEPGLGTGTEASKLAVEGEAPTEFPLQPEGEPGNQSSESNNDVGTASLKEPSTEAQTIAEKDEGAEAGVSFDHVEFVPPGRETNLDNDTNDTTTFSNDVVPQPSCDKLSHTQVNKGTETSVETAEEARNEGRSDEVGDAVSRGNQREDTIGRPEVKNKKLKTYGKTNGVSEGTPDPNGLQETISDAPTSFTSSSSSSTPPAAAFTAIAPVPLPPLCDGAAEESDVGIEPGVKEGSGGVNRVESDTRGTLGNKKTKTYGKSTVDSEDIEGGTTPLTSVSSAAPQLSETGVASTSDRVGEDTNRRKEDTEGGPAVKNKKLKTYGKKIGVSEGTVNSRASQVSGTSSNLVEDTVSLVEQPFILGEPKENEEKGSDGKIGTLVDSEEGISGAVSSPTQLSSLTRLPSAGEPGTLAQRREVLRANKSKAQKAAAEDAAAAAAANAEAARKQAEAEAAEAALLVQEVNDEEECRERGGERSLRREDDQEDERHVGRRFACRESRVRGERSSSSSKSSQSLSSSSSSSSSPSVSNPPPRYPHRQRRPFVLVRTNSTETSTATTARVQAKGGGSGFGGGDPKSEIVSDVPVIDSEALHSVGALVKVAPHTVPGHNSEGGVARVVSYKRAASSLLLYDVKYVLGGRERGVGEGRVAAYGVLELSSGAPSTLATAPERGPCPSSPSSLVSSSSSLSSSPHLVSRRRRKPISSS